MQAKTLNPILNVSNILESFAWFERFGWKKSWDRGNPTTFGGVCEHRNCVAQELEVMWPPADHSWGARNMHVRLPDGHVFRVSQRIRS